MGEALLKADEIKDIEISKFKTNKSRNGKDTKVRSCKETLKKEKIAVKEKGETAAEEGLNEKKYQKMAAISGPESEKSPETCTVRGEACQDGGYQRISMQRSVILNRLRREGCRITRQRKIILDIILEEDCTCCKEIYFMAARRDPNIGMATIYRMVNLLEKIGALKHRRVYHIYGSEEAISGCSVLFDDDTHVRLDAETLRNVIEKGMQSCGYLNSRKVSGIRLGNSE